MKINSSRPIEELVGLNRGIVRQRLGNTHCMSSKLAAARVARPASLRTVPTQLRRGWAKCVLDTMKEYRETYIAVMTGNLNYKKGA